MLFEQTHQGCSLSSGEVKLSLPQIWRQCRSGPCRYRRLPVISLLVAKTSNDHRPRGCTFVRLQEAANASGQQMSLLALSIVKDSRSWGANRGLLDFLEFAHQLDTADP